MRSAFDQLDLPHHSSGWWVGHTAAAVGAGAVLLYGAGVLLALALRVAF
jgi:hypothetical protein